MSDTHQPTGTFDSSSRSSPDRSRHATSLADDFSHVLPVEVEIELDRLCNEFEAGWKASRPRSVEEALVGVKEPLRTAAVRELAALEVFYRKKAGELLGAEEFSTHFPKLDRDWLAGVVGCIDMKARVAMIALPESVGGYRVVRSLGKGGMGIVYLADDPLGRRQVAVKVMRPEFASNPSARERFLMWPAARAASASNVCSTMLVLAT